jgi:hypothetical protein
VSCDPQKVTALVDGALEADERRAVEGHLLDCEACRAQVDEERRLQARLRALPAPEVPFGLDQRVRRRLRGRGRMAAASRLLLPLAAILVVGLWLRGYAPFVAWELSRDHGHCFGMDHLPAEVWSSEPRIVADWFDGRGEWLPSLPASVGPIELVGGRFCRLPDASRVAHVYYASNERQVSVFSVPHAVRIGADRYIRAGGRAVALIRRGRGVLGVVGEDEEEVGAFASRLRTSVAALHLPPELRRGGPRSPGPSAASSR